MRTLCIFVYFILAQNVLLAQQKPLIATAFSKRILNEAAGIKYINYNNNWSFLDSLDLKKDQHQQIIKSDKACYLTTSGSGLVYQLAQNNDTASIFLKIEHTQYDGYNFDDIKCEDFDQIISERMTPKFTSKVYLYHLSHAYRYLFTHIYKHVYA